MAKGYEERDLPMDQPGVACLVLGRRLVFLVSTASGDLYRAIRLGPL